MDIYWIENHEQRGPLPAVEVVSMLENGLIPADSNAWHSGCAEWMPLRDLPAIRSLFSLKDAEADATDAPEDTDPADEDNGESGESANPAEQSTESTDPTAPEPGLVLVVPYPYVRLLARLVDLLMYLMFYFGALRLMDVGFQSDLFPGLSYQSLLYICLPMVVIESVLLSKFGTTPGKGVLGVGVCDYLGRRLSFLDAFKRSLFVMILGCGCYIAPFCGATVFFSWWWVRMIGFTPWDRKLGTTAVLVVPITWRKLIVSVALMVMCAYVIYVCVLPWASEIEAYMQTTAPAP